MVLTVTSWGRSGRPEAGSTPSQASDSGRRGLAGLTPVAAFGLGLVVEFAHPVKEDRVEVFDRRRRVGVPHRPPHTGVGQLRAQSRRQRRVQLAASMRCYLALRIIGKALPEVGVCTHDPMLVRDGSDVDSHPGIRILRGEPSRSITSRAVSAAREANRRATERLRHRIASGAL